VGVIVVKKLRSLEIGKGNPASPPYEKEKFPSLKKRGQGRFWVENVQSIMDSLVEWE